MTILGRGYRTLEYQPTAMVRRLWAIAWLELRVLFRSRWGIVLFLVCQIPVFARLVILMFWSGVWELGGERFQNRIANLRGELDPASPEFYLAPGIGPQAFLFTLILTTLVTARGIAKDRGADALEILWTRGVSPHGYFVAKWAGSFLLVGVGGIAAPFVLWVLAQSMAPDAAFVSATWAFMPRVLVGLAVFVAILTGLATGLSALVRSANLASILWIVLMVGSAAVGRVFARLFRGEYAMQVVSPWDAGKRITEAIAGVTPIRDYPAGIAVAAVLVVGGGLALAVLKRIRLAEAIA